MSRPRRTQRRHPAWRRDSKPGSVPALAWSRIHRPDNPVAQQARRLLRAAQRAQQGGQRVVSVAVLPTPHLITIQETHHA